MTFNPTNSLGPFISTSTFFPDDFDEFRVKFLELYRDLSNAVNTREVGVFDLVEFLTGENWFTSGNPQVKRKTYRKVFELPATAAGATTNIAHGITGVNTTTTFTQIYGTAITAVPDNRPIPFASATLVTDQIQILVNATNIVVTNGATAPNISSGVIVLTYLKN
jgi:hypothetical protein